MSYNKDLCVAILSFLNWSKYVDGDILQWSSCGKQVKVLLSVESKSFYFDACAAMFLLLLFVFAIVR